MPTEQLVDVAISIYGKPHQSAVTLLSLLKHSGQWIDTLYVTIEKKQPGGADFTLLYDLLKPYKVVYQHPAYHIDYFDLTSSRRRYLLYYKPYRHTVRYQYAWEKTDKKYLLVTHNDVLYKDDIVGAYLANIGNAIAIGKVGQCWNCPAHKADNCSGDRYWQYRPDYSEVTGLYEQYGNVRATPIGRVITPEHAWPLPECLLNEYVALINIPVARPLAIPRGRAYTIGVWGPIDTGTAWFRQMSLAGQRVVHFDFDPYAQHAWTNGLNNGHRALSNQSIYAAEEQQAYELLCSEFGLAHSPTGVLHRSTDE